MGEILYTVNEQQSYLKCNPNMVNSLINSGKLEMFNLRQKEKFQDMNY